MSVGRWLLIHSFTIFLVSIFILAYLYREPLQLKQIYQSLLMQPSTPTDVLKTGQKPQQATPISKAKPEQPEELKKPHQETAISNKKDASPQQYLDSSPTAASVDIEIDNLLLKARKAYWEKDYSTAIQYYQQLMKEDENNPDFPGELGNIYYSLNDFENASRHLYGAAMILIKQQKKAQAEALVLPVSAMNRDLGDQLRRQLTPP